jgi:undecaprenyl-diphosphatase
MNEYLFYFFYNFYGKNKVLDFIGFFLAEYLIFFIFLFVFIYFFYKKISWQNYFYILIVSFLSWIFSQIIKMFHLFSRPIDPSASSFPSGHTTIVFALTFYFYYFIYKKNKNLAAKILFLALIMMSGLIGVARVFLGKHWPFDIAAGAILGYLTSSLFYVLNYKFNKKARVS